MKKSYIAASQCYLWRNSWFASWKFYNPSQVRRHFSPKNVWKYL